jgi:hypothetical protein
MGGRLRRRDKKRRPVRSTDRLGTPACPAVEVGCDGQKEADACLTENNVLTSHNWSMTDPRKGPPNRHFSLFAIGQPLDRLDGYRWPVDLPSPGVSPTGMLNRCRCGQYRSAASRSAAPPAETPPSHDSATDRSSYAFSTTQAARAVSKSATGSSLHNRLSIFGAFYSAMCTTHSNLELVANQSLPAGLKLNPSVAMILLSCNCVAAGRRTDGPFEFRCFTCLVRC